MFKNIISCMQKFISKNFIHFFFCTENQLIYITRLLSENNWTNEKSATNETAKS